MSNVEQIRSMVIDQENRLQCNFWGRSGMVDTHNRRIVVWFSCGAASAAVAKILSPLQPDLVYCDTLHDEHPDNLRFLRDIESWTGLNVQFLRSDQFNSCSDVFSKRRYMSGVQGAPCTVMLKKRPRQDWQRPTDIHCFGMDVNETMPGCRRRQNDRIARMNDGNPDLYLSWILRDAGLTKEDCLGMIEGAGIQVPAMYQLGFKNNNCIGCVKSSSPKYWNMVRKHFPKVFEDRAKQSREIGCKLIQRTVNKKRQRFFLDELPKDDDTDLKENLSCGPQCGLQEEGDMNL